ncbi:19640_t:CDS:2 [Funneliformis geosporum]|uniref:15483_t:CDS:1 n=1 Tax=Funneliformis geosporum TaxID=1117311 RepID=A0A9W4SNX5_9GLOM|nr:19640_t:CDS:2 [Funneliformis geosporum]CAI2176281.1 15483_t:CDS:2 [Funneliformis geosporum]
MSMTTEKNNLYALENQKQQQEVSQQQTAVQIENLPTAPPATSLTQGTTCALVHTSLNGTTSQQVSPVKQKRKQVKNACVNCQKACKKCDDGRPCQRCIKYELTATCKDSIRKVRKKGVKRGPYKRRTQKTQGVKISISSTSTPPDIPAPAVIVPVSNTERKADDQFTPIPKILPVNLSQITGTQVPITLTTSDGVGQFVIIPQSSGGVPYYILMPVQRPNQTSTLDTSTCSSMDSSTGSVQDMTIKIELKSQPVKSENVLSKEESQKSKFTATSVTKDANSEIFPNKERDDKDKSNLSVLSLVCSDLLDKDTVSNEQANKEMSENLQDGESLKVANATKQNINTSVSWSSVNYNKQEFVSPKSKDIDSVKIQPENLKDKSPKASGKAACCGGSQAMDTPRVNNPPTFETPSVGSPLLFSIPANTYPVIPVEYMTRKRESSIDNVKRSKYHHEDFPLPQHGASFSQNQIPMQQPYYGIPPFFTLPHSSNNTYMAQNSSSPYYHNQHMPQQFTPTSLSFAFNPGMSNANALQSHNQGYANASASTISDVSSQMQKNYSSY